MDIDHRAELFRLAPERPQLRIAELHRSGRGRDRRALEPQFTHASLELGDSERRHMQRQRAEPGQPRRMGGDGLGDPIVGGAREPQARLCVGPFQALMHEACAQHLNVDAHCIHVDDLNVDAHCIHVDDAVGEIAHAGDHRGGAVSDAPSHLIGDAGVGGQLGKNIVLRRQGVDLGHDDVGVEIDCARTRAARQRHSLIPCRTRVSRDVAATSPQRTRQDTYRKRLPVESRRKPLEPYNAIHSYRIMRPYAPAEKARAPRIGRRRRLKDHRADRPAAGLTVGKMAET